MNEKAYQKLLDDLLTLARSEDTGERWKGDIAMRAHDALSALPPLRAREEIARARVAIPDLLKRADEILCDTANRGNTGPHNLISDMAACLNAVILSSTAGQEWRDGSPAPPVAEPLVAEKSEVKS